MNVWGWMAVIVREEVRRAIASRHYPTKAWRLIYMLRRSQPGHLAWHKAGPASRSCIGEIMKSHNGSLETTTPFAGRINLADGAWIGDARALLLGTSGFAQSFLDAVTLCP